MASNRIYIIDDDSALRRTIRRMLAELDAEIEEFSSAETFISQSLEGPTGCVLLDVRLPGMSGLELLERVAALNPPHPVIMLSGFGDIPSAVRAVKMGALDFLQKPFQRNELLDLVESAFDWIAVRNEGDRELQALTPREREILQAFSGGAPNKIVAAELGLSPRTVEMHRARIFRKLGVTNLTQALVRARNGGMNI